MQPSTLQASGQAVAPSSDNAEIAGMESVSSQPLVGLQSYGSEPDSGSSSSGGHAPHENGQNLGPFF